MANNDCQACEDTTQKAKVANSFPKPEYDLSYRKDGLLAEIWKKVGCAAM